MKIIVRGANWIGDAVMTIPALRALRNLYPESNITLYTKSWAEGIFQDAGFVDRILRVEADGSGIKDAIRESRRVAKGDYDLAVLFTNSFVTATIVRLAGIKRRIGYSREGRGILLTDRIKPPAWRDERHQSAYYLHLIEELARRDGQSLPLTPGSENIILPVSDERRKRARSILIEAGIDLERPTIGLGVGSTNSTAKRWGEAKFASLADMIAGHQNANILLMGSIPEIEVSSQVRALAITDIVDLTGSTDLASATAILSEIDIFVSNDMGLAHVAAAVGTKTLVIFGPTNDVTTRPFGENARTIRHAVECSPCMLRECPIDHRCMIRIEPETVFGQVLEMLDG